ncbi:MobV family relaxase [Staphylococcus haemolyticus]|nr:MobV family relaxase [Staphylococcus haemolyticus]MDU0440728.1 MobV family relaxase [Staphylococcus haemolyticus]
MSMIVARMQKMKAENLVGIGNHNQRKTKNHSNPDIDTSLSKLNYDLVDRTQNYKTDIENFINENKSTTRAVRKDAVLVNEWIISSDKDFFDNLTESEIENFFERSKDYFAEKFGEKNIRYATVHLDESTPHMHMGIVPFDKDNKLSAKRVFNRQALRDV